jgi:cyclophilin family peptidyl-prolyl cis-trans isomerase/HEAT repeat protein
MLTGCAVRRKVILGLLAAMFLLGTGCLPDHSDRDAGFAALARWEDRRLAPQDSLTALLRHPDAHLRLAASRTAGLIGRSDVLPVLLENLEDPSATVVRQAAFSLGLLGDTAAVEALEKTAHDPHAATRVAALRGLAHLPHEGQALLAASAARDKEESMAAWDGLRNLTASVDSTALHQALTAGLNRAETDILWRVLRCSERAMTLDLLPAVAPLARSAHPQVRVHAYRALSRLDDPRALAAVVAGGQNHGPFADRHRQRVDMALLRAIGSLAAHNLQLADDPDDPEVRKTRDFLITTLITGAGDAHPHVAETALTAAAAVVEDSPLPDEAADQESLLPVWRIRLARAARSHLAHETPAVRAAAITAWARLRGAGAGPVLVTLLDREKSVQSQVALVDAISRVHPRPLDILGQMCHPEADTSVPVRTAALSGLARAVTDRPETVSTSRIRDLLTAGAAHDDFVVAATSAELLGDFPHRLSLIALAELWDAAAGPEKADLQLAVLASVGKLGARIGELDRPEGHLESLFQVILRESFDVPDFRVRDRARQVALETGLLPEELIPSRGSLKATLPAVVRAAAQPPVTLPFDASRVRCVTPRGDFIITLKVEEAPNTCASFLHLIRQGFYDDLIFHRVVPDFVVQGGCPRGDGWGGPGYTIRSEWSRLPFQRQAVGIAHSGKDTGGSQFFVTLSEQPHLDGRYTVFGEVTRGMDVVDQLTVGDTFRLEILP